MSYPEKGAGYSHKPKFIERMKRAEGGAAPQPSDLYDPEQLESIASQEKRFNPPSAQDQLAAKQVDPNIELLNTPRSFGSNPHGSIDAQGKVHGMKRGGHKK
jgi:hypothetical protein